MHHPEPVQQAIIARAHALWEAEGRPEGKSIEHWLTAEAEVTGKLKAKSTAKKSATAKAGVSSASKAAASRRKV